MKVPVRLPRLFFAVLILSTLAAPSLIAQSIKIHVDVSDISGEATDNVHFGWIEAVACSDGILAPPATSSGGIPGRTVFSPIRIMKAVDKASPSLRQLAATRQPTTPVTIDFVRSGVEAPYTYLKIQLDGALVNEISMTTEGPSVSQEILILSYQRITVTYWPLNANGGIGAPIVFKWDVAKDVPF